MVNVRTELQVKYGSYSSVLLFFLLFIIREREGDGEGGREREGEEDGEGEG